MEPFREETFHALRRASASTQWPGYSRFAALQGRGLRQDALSEARVFATELGTRSLEERWQFVSWLLGDVMGPNVVLEVLVPSPLKQRLFLPTLQEKREQHMSCPEAFLWK